MSSENWADKLRNFEKELEKKNEVERNAKLTERLKQEKRIRYESEKSLELLKDLGVKEMLQGIRNDLWGVGVVTSFKFDPEKNGNLSTDDCGWAEYVLSFKYPYRVPPDREDEVVEHIAIGDVGLGLGITYNTILNYVSGKRSSDNGLEGLFVQRSPIIGGYGYVVIPLNERINQDLERVLIEDAHGRNLPYTDLMNRKLVDITVRLKSNPNMPANPFAREIYEDFVRKGTLNHPTESIWWTPPDKNDLTGNCKIWQLK